MCHSCSPQIIGHRRVDVDEDRLDPIAKSPNRALKLKGKTFGTVPFGYRRNIDGGLDPQPGQIEIVHEIVAMRAQGAKLADIAAYLTTANVATRRGGR